MEKSVGVEVFESEFFPCNISLILPILFKSIYFSTDIHKNYHFIIGQLSNKPKISNRKYSNDGPFYVKTQNGTELLTMWRIIDSFWAKIEVVYT